MKLRRILKTFQLEKENENKQIDNSKQKCVRTVS